MVAGWEMIYTIWSNYSDLTRPHPKWWFSTGNPLISGKSRLVKYYSIWPDTILYFPCCRVLIGLFSDESWLVLGRVVVFRVPTFCGKPQVLDGKIEGFFGKP